MEFGAMKNDSDSEKGILELPECQEKIKQAKDFLEQVKFDFGEKRNTIETNKHLLEKFYQKGWDENIYQAEIKGKINELEEYLKEEKAAALSFYKVEEIIESLKSQMGRIEEMVNSIEESKEVQNEAKEQE